MVEVRVATTSLPELTATVLAASLQAEDAEATGRGCTVVLRIDGAVPGTRFAWPGRADVAAVGKWESALRRLEQAPAPIVAIVAGDAFGPAAELLLVADYRMMSAGTVFEMAATGSGVWPSMAVHRLGGQLGGGRARQLVVLGRSLSAERACADGLIDSVIEPGDEAGTIEAVLGALGSAAGPEIAIRRRLLLDAASTRYEDALGAHLAAADRALRHERSGS